MPSRAIGSGNRLHAKPTLAHHALAALGRKKLVKHWLQQNHDRLAQKAGWPQERLNEIHGAWGDDYNPVVQMDGGLRPDLEAWLRETEATADFCLAIGTSLCGMNADGVAAACETLVIVGLQPTPFDARCAVRVWGLADDFMALLAKKSGVRALPDPKCARIGEEWDRVHPSCRYRTPKRKPT